MRSRDRTHGGGLNGAEVKVCHFEVLYGLFKINRGRFFLSPRIPISHKVLDRERRQYRSTNITTFVGLHPYGVYNVCEWWEYRWKFTEVGTSVLSSC